MIFSVNWKFYNLNFFVAIVLIMEIDRNYGNLYFVLKLIAEMCMAENIDEDIYMEFIKFLYCKYLCK